MSLLRNLILTFAFVSGCAIPGADEFTTYSEAYESARLASVDVLTVYVEFEKVKRGARVDQRSFDPDNAYLYVKDAPSPTAEKIARGFRAATVYNEVLARYATNQTLTLFDNDIASLRESTTTIGDVVGGAAVAAKINAVVSAAETLANLSLAKSDREEFILALDAGAETVDGFLSVIRDDTATMYEDAASATSRRIAAGQGSVADLRAKRDAFREMLAKWVLLIDETRSDLATLTVAVKAGKTGGANLTRIARSAERLAAYADQISAAKIELIGVF